VSTKIIINRSAIWNVDVLKYHKSRSRQYYFIFSKIKGDLAMESRRKFLKDTVCTLGYGIILPSSQLVSSANLSETKKKEHPVGPTRSGITWRRNIFCQFDHAGLKAAVEKCAIETDCTIFYADNGYPDIHACPAFVMIVDRRDVGFDLWKEHVEYSDMYREDIPCFIVDNISHLELPKKKYVYQFDLNDEAAIPTIVKTITEMKTEMDRRLPSLFKNGSSNIKCLVENI